NFLKADRSCHLVKFGSSLTECRSKKLENTDDMPAIPWPHAIRQVKDNLAPAVLRQRRTLPEDTTCIDWQQSCDCLQEGSLARTIRANQTKNFTAPDIERNINQRSLLAIPLGYAGNL